MTLVNEAVHQPVAACPPVVLGEPFRHVAHRSRPPLPLLTELDRNLERADDFFDCVRLPFGAAQEANVVEDVEVDPTQQREPHRL
jgi:hypothetical protein